MKKRNVALLFMGLTFIAMNALSHITVSDGEVNFIDWLVAPGFSTFGMILGIFACILAVVGSIIGE